MKKLLWVMAALFVSFAVAAQNRDNVGRIIINSAEEFLKIGTTYSSSESYIQTANIDLGDKGTMYTPIITTFSGMYDEETVRHWLKTFVRRFFQQQYKRSCLPDGPKVGSVSLSPRGDWRMPSDASPALWQLD